MTQHPDIQTDTQKIVQIAREAGELLRSIYEQNTDLAVEHKSDNSPVTIADMQAHELIVDRLTALDSTIPILSEEDVVPYEQRKSWSRFWCVDPLDGTKGFISRSGEFCVNIALIENCKPTLGVIDVPMTRECYFADETGAYKQGQDQPTSVISVATEIDTLRIAVSRHYKKDRLEALLGKNIEHELLHSSSALKFGWVAEGKAHLYPRLFPTSEWDTAAGQCIVEQAGGQVVDLSGNVLRYNKENLLNPDFVASGGFGEI